MPIGSFGDPWRSRSRSKGHAGGRTKSPPRVNSGIYRVTTTKWGPAEGGILKQDALIDPLGLFETRDPNRLIS
jgi:hypothetical protein